MNILTYVEGILTVIRGGEFFSDMHEKPPFIKGLNFYYEPTLKVVDGKELSKDEIEDTEEYIANFLFHSAPIVLSVFCVNSDGEYMGYKAIEDGEFEVPTEKPNNEPYVVWDFEAKEWTEVVCVDKDTGLYLGKWFKSAFQNSIYVRASLVHTDFCIESQTYDFNTKAFVINIDVVRNKTLLKINSLFAQQVNVTIGVVGFGEMSSWKLQEDEARAWVLDNTMMTPLIDALLVGRNLEETKEALINKIITKADAYKVFYGGLLGKLHAKQKEIELAPSLEALKAIVW